MVIIPLAELIEDSNPLKGLDLTSTRNIISEKDIVDNKKRCYCIDRSSTENEVVGYDSNDHPFVHHSSGKKHRVIFWKDRSRLARHRYFTLW